MATYPEGANLVRGTVEGVALCRLLSLFLVSTIALLSACSADEPVVDEQVPCTACHDLELLQEPEPYDSVQAWLAVEGDGLLRKSVFPVFPDIRWGTRIPPRGYHSDTRDCVTCHPEGSAEAPIHGERRYPAETVEVLFSRGESCAGTDCHQWLTDSPTDLLNGAPNKHTGIFHAGFHVSEGGDHDLAIIALRPGCGSCHNIHSGDHGGLPDCNDCHLFREGVDTGLHTRHVDLIAEQTQETRTNSDDFTPCSYCHGFAADAAETFRASCYNCHLSGHQPFGSDGQPQMWP